MRWPVRPGRGAAVPTQVRAALSLAASGERLLGAAHAGRAGSERVWLLATTWRLAAVAEDGALGWVRPWHEVEAASWSREAGELTVTFVDGRRPLAFPLEHDALFLQLLRERVQASLIAVDEVTVSGRAAARAVLRHDLATGEVLEQLVGIRGGRPGRHATEAAAAVFDRLREEVGMPPRRPEAPPDAPPE